MKFIKNPLVALLPLLVLFSCKEEEEKPALPEPVWEEHEGFMYSRKVTYNSYADSNNLYILGRNSITPLLDYQNLDGGSHYIIWDYDQSFKMPLSSDFMVRASRSSVEFISMLYPVTYGYNFVLSIPELDDDFKAFAFPYLYAGEAMVINSRNECLIPYITQSEPFVKLLLVSMEVDENGAALTYLDTIGTKIYSIHSGDTRVVMETVDEKFFVTTAKSTYMIDGLKQLKEVSEESIYGIFEQNGKIYGRAKFGELYTSVDGESWELVGAFSTRLDVLTFEEMGDSTLAYYNSQIFSVNVTGNQLSLTELENKGLEGNGITSISQFQDEVYVTSYSGVFHKKVEDFWQPKEEQ